MPAAGIAEALAADLVIPRNSAGGHGPISLESCESCEMRQFRTSQETPAHSRRITVKIPKETAHQPDQTPSEFCSEGAMDAIYRGDCEAKRTLIRAAIDAGLLPYGREVEPEPEGTDRVLDLSDAAADTDDADGADDAVKVDRSSRNDGRITVSVKSDLDPHRMDNQDANKAVALLLSELAKVIAHENEYEFNGVDEAMFGGGTVSLTMDLFIP